MMMVMRMILKFALLGTIGMMLFLSITDLTMNQIVMVFHLNIKEEEIKDLIRNPM
jgi:hypothetical protein